MGIETKEASWNEARTGGESPVHRLWEHMRISRRHVVAGLATILLWPCIWAQAGAGTAEAPDVFLAELTDRAVAQLTEPGLAQQEQESR